MLQGAKSPDFAKDILQRRLDCRIARATAWNIRFSSAKPELMHMIRFSSNTSPNTRKGILLHGIENIPSDIIKCFGVIIDNRFSFRIQAAATVTRTIKLAGFIARTMEKKVASPGAINHLVTTVILPGILWGSQLCWTNAAHNISELNPTNHTLARYITSLPKQTPLP